MIEKANPNSILGILQKLDELKNNLESEPGAWIILTSLYFNGTSRKSLIHQNHLSKLEHPISTDLAIKILDILNSGKSTGFITINDQIGVEANYILEVIQPLSSLIILGAGHVGRSLSLIAAVLGFEVALVDDREEFLKDDQISNYGVRKVCLSFDNYSESIVVTSNCAIVIVTRGHQSDEVCLKNAIHTNAKYIGMIGSKRRVLAIVKNLKESDLSEKQLAKLEGIFAPIGLEIGAKSPQDIAISILAQIIQVMNSSF